MNVPAHPPDSAHGVAREQAQSVTQTSSLKDWRLESGYLSTAGSDFESSHILLGRFIADRCSPNSLVEQSLTAENATFEWGRGRPLERVVDSQAAFETLMLNPRLYRNAIAII
ncbi:MAG: hypothetical protein AAGB19_11410 [Cyanobacteria bacterium P01_F01_bin.3]